MTLENEIHRLRIGIIVRPIEQGTSGSGSHLEQLLNALIKNHDYLNIVALRYGHDPLGIEGVAEEVRISRNPITASRQIRKQALDVIHYSPLTILSPIWVGSIARVATVHGSAGAFKEAAQGWVKEVHAKYAQPWLMRKMDYIFTVSHTSKQFLSQVSGLAEGRFRVTYNGTRFGLTSIDKEVAATIVSEKLGLNRPFILHVSKYSERKNPWTLLKAFQSVIAETASDDLCLVIVGAGWRNGDVQNFVRESGLDGRVILAGFVSERLLNCLYSCAEIFVFPSLYEGFGMPNIEAMSVGCPVITTRAFAIPEIVKDGAMLMDEPSDSVELAEKITYMLRESTTKTQLIRRGVDVARGYSWSESASIVARTYCAASSRQVQAL